VLNQNKNKMQLFTKMLEIFLTPKILGPPKSVALDLSVFSLMVNPPQAPAIAEETDC